MFIIHLMGGLGNQMFQYAAGRALSLERSIDFCLDFDCNYKNVKNKYELSNFIIQPKFANFLQLFKSKPKRKLLKRVYRILGKNVNCKLVKETNAFTFDKSFFEVPDESYLSGFWQSEQYFKRYENTIRADFTFKQLPSALNQKFIDQISSQNAISVHVRRGDYVKFADTNKLHGLCTPEYYRIAIDYIKNNVDNPSFYFFSDDIEWVEQHLNFKDVNATYIGHNKGEKAYEDMRLMQYCKHNIIANSSFSWWGAWLNSFPQKIVIAPKRWMNIDGLNTDDLIPDSWIRL